MTQCLKIVKKSYIASSELKLRYFCGFSMKHSWVAELDDKLFELLKQKSFRNCSMALGACAVSGFVVDNFMLPFLCACVCEHLEYRQLINHVKRIMVFWFAAQLDAIKCFVQLLVFPDNIAQLVHSRNSSITQFKDRQNFTQHQEALAMFCLHYKKACCKEL